MRVLVIVLLLFFSLSFLIPIDSDGLSCERVDMKQHFAESDVVFSGKAMSQEYFPSEYGFANGRNDTKTQFHIIELFKGNNTEAIGVISSEWFWGYDFNKGSEYVVFAYYDDNGDLRYQTCTPTSLLEDADIVKIRQTASFDESISITQKQIQYNIPYKITNGVIDDVFLSCEDGSLLLQLISQNESGVNLTLNLPRSVFDPKINDKDGAFIVLRDGQEIDYQGIPYTKHRQLSMSFSADTDEIEIIHAFIPELKPKMCEIVHDPPYSFIVPPQQQLQSGIPFNEIKCKQNLVLLQKYDGTPACVTEPTKQKLIERGWVHLNSLTLVRNDNNLYCGSSEGSSDHCYSLEEIVFGNAKKSWKVYPGAGIALPENSPLTPIYKKNTLGMSQIDLTAMLDDQILVNKCESNGGMWNFTYHDCELSWSVCNDMGGIIIQQDVSPPCTDTGIIDDDPLKVKVCRGAATIRTGCVFQYNN